MAVVFTSHAKQALTEYESKARQALEICGGMAESYAKQLCPVDTGNLRNSITHQQEGPKTEVIGTNVSYAAYVELGTVKMAAKPYLRPAVEGHAAEYKAIIQSIMGK